MIEQSVTRSPQTLGAAAPVEVLTRREQLTSRLHLQPDAAWALARFSVDATMLLAAALASSLGARAAGVDVAPPAWLALFAVLVVVTFATRGMYRPRLRADILEELRGVIAATSLAAMAVLTLLAIFTEPADLTAQSIRPWAFATVYLAAGRVALHWSRTQARRHGEALRPTLIVGAGRIGRLTARRLIAHPELGLKPIGFLDKEPMEAEEHGGVLLPVLGSSWDLDRVIAEQGVQQVIITFSTAPSEVLLRMVQHCEELGVNVAFIPRLFEKMNSKLTIDYLGGLPLVVPRPSNPRGVQFAIKYACDRVLAAVMLILTAPIMVAAAVGILLTLGRPVFFRQRRVGRDGREFDMLKFRTMRHPEEVDEVGYELPPDTAPGGVEGADRRTPFGAFLRRSSIDELPQLLNVVKGDMSLIGPRPERPAFVGLFEQSVYRYTDRHRVKSGITGWSQVNGLRGKTSLADRVEWDNYYIENWSLWLDIKILLLTTVSILRFSRQVE